MKPEDILISEEFDYEVILKKFKLLSQHQNDISFNPTAYRAFEIQRQYDYINKVLQKLELISSETTNNRPRSINYQTFLYDISTVFEEKNKPVISLIESLKSESSYEHKELIALNKKIAHDLEKLRKDNLELSKMIDERYPAKILFVSAISVTLFLVFSIFSWFVVKVHLVHPIISFPLLIGSIGFSILSFWRMK